MQFALIVIAFFVLSVNAVAAPESGRTAVNPLLDYKPEALAQASVEISEYIPVLQDIPDQTVQDQVLSSVVGPETAYVPKPMLVETVDHDTANRVLRGLRGETIHHTVQQGETLGKIATHYGINVATLLETNDIDVADINKIRPGRELAIAPETTVEGADWLDKLHEEERKAREAREKQETERKAKLAKATSTKRIGTSTAVAAGSTDSSGGSGKFRKPIGTGCYNGYHWYAIDCPASPGTAIRAAAGGRVVVADTSGYNGGYGMTILVDHGNGWETRYAHMSSVNVSVGDTISSGEVVGGVGNTGRSTGPHLHFEIVKNGQRLNPVNYVGT